MHLLCFASLLNMLDKFSNPILFYRPITARRGHFLNATPPLHLCSSCCSSCCKLLPPAQPYSYTKLHLPQANPVYL